MLLKFLELFFNGESWWSMRWFYLFFRNIFNGEKWCDIRWCSMLIEFLEIFFIGERWHVMRWCGILNMFRELKLMTCSGSYKYKYIRFLEILMSYNTFFYSFLNYFQWRNVTWDEVISLIFRTFFNGEMRHDMLLEFSELFFNREIWCGMLWFSLILRIIFQ
jgi:hypothetical protein